MLLDDGLTVTYKKIVEHDVTVTARTCCSVFCTFCSTKCCKCLCDVAPHLGKVVGYAIVTAPVSRLNLELMREEYTRWSQSLSVSPFYFAPKPSSAFTPALRTELILRGISKASLTVFQKELEAIEFIVAVSGVHDHTFMKKFLRWLPKEDIVKTVGGTGEDEAVEEIQEFDQLSCLQRVKYYTNSILNGGLVVPQLRASTRASLNAIPHARFYFLHELRAQYGEEVAWYAMPGEHCSKHNIHTPFY